MVMVEKDTENFLLYSGYFMFSVSFAGGEAKLKKLNSMVAS
jgi:hypothetical protein